MGVYEIRLEEERRQKDGRTGVCVVGGGWGQDTWPHTLGQETRQAERSTSPKQVGRPGRLLSTRLHEENYYLRKSACGDWSSSICLFRNIHN